MDNSNKDNHWGKIKTNKYEVILDICKTGSFSKTARNLNYSQAALSQMVKAYETELGFPIFKRTNSGVVLIPSAQDVINSLEIIHHELEKIKSISDSITNEKSGCVRLRVFFSFATTYLPKLLLDFKALYPDITFTIFTGNQNEICKLLEQGSIDIAITSEASVKNYHYQKNIQDELMVVLPTNHPLTLSSSVSIYALDQESYILSGEKLKYEIGDIFNAAQITPNYSYEFYDELVALRFIEADFGISVFSHFFLKSIPNYA